MVRKTEYNSNRLENLAVDPSLSKMNFSNCWLADYYTMVLENWLFSREESLVVGLMAYHNKF